MEVAVVVVKTGRVYGVENPRQAQPVRTKREAWFLNMAGIGSLELARLSSSLWWMGMGTSGGGVIMLAESVDAILL